MKTILVVDDTPTNLLSFKMLFKYKLRGIAKVETATSVAEAKRRLAKGNIDLVLSDVNLGDGLGPEIKKAYPKVPFIYTTSNDDWKSPDKSPMLPKTTDPNKLVQTIKAALGESMRNTISKVAAHQLSVTDAVRKLLEVSPPGFSGTTKSMKKHKEITNPFALSWWMYKKGAKSHKKPEPDAKGIKRYIPPEEYAKRKEGKVIKLPSRTKRRKKRLAASLEN